MKYRISHPTGIIQGHLKLPASKSISNRLLIIQQAGKLEMQLLHPASSKDTQALQTILSSLSDQTTFDVGHAGTAMRFLTALFAVTEGERTLTGSERMKERPIKELVDCLLRLGADIQYTGKEGFPPLLIKGKKLSGGKLKVDSSISSQYISALMMITPLLDSDLEIELQGETVSEPYIDMTLRLMQEFGAKVSKNGRFIHCSNNAYVAPKKDYSIEADWSAASYLYSILALAQTGSALTIEGLSEKSLQADAICTRIFSTLGVESHFEKNGLLRIEKKATVPAQEFNYDFSDCPDIAQTLAVTISALGMDGKLEGLSTLKIKETDRILALQNELKKAGIGSEGTTHSLHIKRSALKKQPDSSFSTYNDHRMALALAPLALVMDYIEIERPEVVEKSYPEYWDHLRQLGFRIASVFSE